MCVITVWVSITITTNELSTNFVVWTDELTNCRFVKPSGVIYKSHRGVYLSSGVLAKPLLTVCKTIGCHFRKPYGPLVSKSCELWMTANYVVKRTSVWSRANVCSLHPKTRRAMSFVTSKVVFIGTYGNDPVGVGGNVTINEVMHYRFDLSEQWISGQAIFQSRIPQIPSHGRIHTTPSWVSP